MASIETEVEGDGNTFEMETNLQWKTPRNSIPKITLHILTAAEIETFSNEY